MPTITIEVPKRVLSTDLRLNIEELDDKQVIKLLSSVIEAILSPTDEDIRNIAEFLEEKAWESAKKDAQL